ncbi:MAG: hypothetical protein OXF41_21640 [bacterium]|nr:hypothetical protein [bacterium]
MIDAIHYKRNPTGWFAFDGPLDVIGQDSFIRREPRMLAFDQPSIGFGQSTNKTPEHPLLVDTFIPFAFSVTEIAVMLHR